jgi:hypothetical protein
MLAQDRLATFRLGAVPLMLFDRILLDLLHHVGDPLTDLLRLEVSPARQRVEAQLEPGGVVVLPAGLATTVRRRLARAVEP